MTADGPPQFGTRTWNPANTGWRGSANPLRLAHRTCPRYPGTNRVGHGYDHRVSDPDQAAGGHESAERLLGTAGVARRPVGHAEAVGCPEGLREQDAHLLGDVAGNRVLEVGCGAAMCARWLTSVGADAVAMDLSGGMLRHAGEANRRTGLKPPLVQADAAS